MSQLLEIAEQYYAVARDMDYDIQEKVRIRDYLNRRADELCEANMRIEADREKRAAPSCSHLLAMEPTEDGNLRCKFCGFERPADMTTVSPEGQP